MPKRLFRRAFWHLDNIGGALYLLIIVLSVAVMVVLFLQYKHTNRRIDAQQQQICRVTSAFIESSLSLRNSQNHAGVQSIGQRQKLIRAASEIIAVIRVLTAQPAPANVNPEQLRNQRLFASLLSEYLKASNDLDRRLNQSSVMSLNAAGRAADTWDRLRERLQC